MVFSFVIKYEEEKKNQLKNILWCNFSFIMSPPLAGNIPLQQTRNGS